MRYATGVMLVLVAGVIWSTLGLLLRQIDQAGTWAVLFWRSLGSLPVLFGVIWWRAGRPRLGGLVAILLASGLPAIVGGAGLVVAFWGAIASIQSTTVANAVFLYSASPFVAAVLGRVLLGERVRVITWVAIGLAGAGIFLMVREGLSTGAVFGNMAALASACGFAIFSLSLRWGRTEEMLPAVALGATLAMIVAGVMLAVTGQAVWVPASDILVSMFMGGGVVSVGMALYTAGSRALPAAELTLLSMVEVMLAPIWVWWLMGEGASSATLVGGAVLLAAITLNAVSRRG